MTINTISDIETQLALMSKTALQQIGRNVGVARFYALRMGELREAILAIAKGEIEPLPIYKRHIYQPILLYNQDVVDAVLSFSELNLHK